MAHTKTQEEGFIYIRSGDKTRAQKYETVLASYKDALRSGDPQIKARVEKMQSGLLRLKEVGPGQVQDNRFLANLSVQYSNDEYIGDYIMPEVQTPSMAGEFPKYDKRSRVGDFDDTMSNRATANEVSDARSVDTYSCQPRALRNHVGVLTLRNQKAPLDEMIDLTEALSDDMQFLREKRIATAVTTAASYATGNKKTLTGSQIWDQTGSAPVQDIQAASAALWSGKGPSEVVAAMSIDVWNVLASHPQVIDLTKYTSPGLATPSAFATIFGIDKLLVSRSRMDTANEGQTASYSRIWGKYFWMGRVAKNPTIRNASFGSTLRFGPIKTEVWFDQLIGTEGGYWARVSSVEQQKVIAADTAYLISAAIS